jgi:serine/threonine protein phosphatase 1
MKRIVIGDIHGKSHLLEKLVEYHGRENQFIFLGDYIDRGESSREVIDYIIKLPQKICLMGNHEDLLIRFLKGNDPKFDDEFSPLPPLQLEAWLSPENGGKKTLDSFQLDSNSRWSDLKEEYQEFFSNLRYFFEDTYSIYVHAGLDIDIENMEDQDLEYLLWVRTEWLKNRYIWYGKMVFFGHTITHNYPHLLNKYGLLETPTTLGIDTGAYFTGILTSIDIEGPDQYSVIQYDGVSGKIIDYDKM